MTTEPTTAIAPTPVQGVAVMPVMDIQAAIQRRNAIVAFVKQVMVEGTDYGKIPGTDKPTLLKPGAEKLNTLFGLSSRFQLAEHETDWTGANHNGEQFFYFVYRCQLFYCGSLVAEADGSCNSMEKKYRWRKAERTCPECGKAAIIKGNAQYGGGWLCWKKKDGCGAKFPDNDKRIVEQEVGQGPNPDIADIVNTLQKMAQKRALVAATLLAVNASEFFTQDVEDMEIIEGVYNVKATSQTTQPQPQPQNGSTAHAPVAMPDHAFRNETLTAIYANTRKHLTDINTPLNQNGGMMDAFKAARYQAKERGLEGDIEKYNAKTSTPCGRVAECITDLLVACQEHDDHAAEAEAQAQKNEPPF